MTYPTPLGPISIPIEQVRLALADSSAFRAWAGAEDRPAALRRIQLGDTFTDPDTGRAVDLDKDGEVPIGTLERLRPFAQVSLPAEGLQLTRESASSTSATFSPSITIEVALEQSVPPELRHDAQHAGREFDNSVGLIMLDLATVGVSHPYPSVVGLSLTTPPTRTNRMRQPAIGDAHVAVIQVQLSTSAGG